MSLLKDEFHIYVKSKILVWKIEFQTCPRNNDLSLLRLNLGTKILVQIRSNSCLFLRLNLGMFQVEFQFCFENLRLSFIEEVEPCGGVKVLEVNSC